MIEIDNVSPTTLACGFTGTPSDFDSEMKRAVVGTKAVDLPVAATSELKDGIVLDTF